MKISIAQISNVSIVEGVQHAGGGAGQLREVDHPEPLHAGGAEAARHCPHSRIQRGEVQK